MISEGPALIEALPGELQGALNAALRADEEVLIAVRGNIREAFAATRDRLLLLKEPAISGAEPVAVREVPLESVSNIRAEPRPVGGRLVWETTITGAPAVMEYPTYDASKYNLVAKRLQEMIGQRRTPNTPGTAPAEPPVTPVDSTSRACPKCRTMIPADGSWCPRCGLQAFDPCWECGKPLPEGGNFCAWCGTPNTEPAVVQCPQCDAVVGRGQAYCTSCGAQARPVCEECERAMRREWAHCPSCGGSPAWEGDGIRPERARPGEDELKPGSAAPGAWLETAPRDRDGEELNAAGVQAYEAGDHHEAARLFQEAVDADPENASYHTNLGVAYGELGDDLQAFTAYRRAVELEPREVSAYLNMGYLYNERERAAEAREMWEKVIQVAPDSDEAKEARENLRNLENV
jgi:RNA polymerase subunit RPABC4/transcription elongation factor Spt4